MSKIVIELHISPQDGDGGSSGENKPEMVTALELVDKYTDPTRFSKILLTFSKEQLRTLLKGLEEEELYEYCQIVLDRIKEVENDG